MASVPDTISVNLRDKHRNSWPALTTVTEEIETRSADQSLKRLASKDDTFYLYFSLHQAILGFFTSNICSIITSFLSIFALLLFNFFFFPPPPHLLLWLHVCTRLCTAKQGSLVGLLPESQEGRSRVCISWEGNQNLKGPDRNTIRVAHVISLSICPVDQMGRGINLTLHSFKSWTWRLQIYLYGELTQL